MLVRDGVVPPTPELQSNLPFGTRMLVKTVRVQEVEERRIPMKQDSLPDNRFERFVLTYNHCCRSLQVKAVFDTVLLAGYLGCFYMMYRTGSTFWFYPLFWLDYFLQVFAFYFYYKYPRKFGIQAFTLCRTSVYVQEMLVLVAKPALLWVIDIGGSETVGCIGICLVLLVASVENTGKYY